MKKAGYEHEVEKPKVPSKGHEDRTMGCDDFKSDAMEIAFGQAGKAGVKSDKSKISAQYKDYHWSE